LVKHLRAEFAHHFVSTQRMAACQKATDGEDRMSLAEPNLALNMPATGLTEAWWQHVDSACLEQLRIDFIDSSISPPLFDCPSGSARPQVVSPKDFHWIVPGVLAGVAQPGTVGSLDFDLSALCAEGITTLVSLTERALPTEALSLHGLRHLHLPIRRGELPSAAQARVLALRISKLTRQGQVLAVHGLTGFDRTGVVLAAFLVQEGMAWRAALTWLRRIHASHVPTLEQEAFLQAFEQGRTK
jgi:hypothetical protein